MFEADDHHQHESKCAHCAKSYDGGKEGAPDEHAVESTTDP